MVDDSSEVVDVCGEPVVGDTEVVEDGNEDIVGEVVARQVAVAG